MENAAKTDATLEEKRAEELTKWHNERARVLRKALVNQMFEQAPGPSPDALRFVLMAEIVAAKDFKQDQLWVEYDIRYDPEIWAVKPEPSEPGHLQGCTHVSTCAKYPGEPGARRQPQVPHFTEHPTPRAACPRTVRHSPWHRCPPMWQAGACYRTTWRTSATPSSSSSSPRGPPSPASGPACASR